MNKRRRRRNDWKNYAAATAGLVGTAVGMETNVARADLVTDIPDITIGVGQMIFLDLDRSSGGPVYASTTNFAGSDLRLVNSNSSPDYLWAGVYNPGPSSGGGNLLLAAVGQFNMRKLGEGYSVGPSSMAWSENAFGYFEKPGFGPFYWEGGGEGFIGVRLDAGGGNHRYGWAQLTYDDTNDTLTLHGFAISDTANTAITTAAIPEAQSLAACSLALGGVLGAQGVLAYRRRKKELATA